MKVTVFLFLILVSLNSFSEEYVCSLDLSQIGREDEMEIKTYERIGGVFKKTSDFGVSILEITKETEEFIILNETHNYPHIYLTFINKKNKNTVEDYIIFEDPEIVPRMTGKCLIKN
tara:strand:+ start:143 stop:493 length:351 start_codon:yes stop_codon:yes gene_type:complete